MRVAIAVVLGAVAAALIATGARAARSAYLAISAESPGKSESVLSVKVYEDGVRIVAQGGRPFIIHVDSSYPVEPSQVYIAMSDGRVYRLEDGCLDYSCDYLIRYYGLVLAVYGGGRVRALSFRTDVAWALEDDDLIPEESPAVQKPESEDEELQRIIDEWWEIEVVPKDRQFRKEWFGAE